MRAAILVHLLLACCGEVAGMTTYTPDEWSVESCTWGTDVDLETNVTGAITSVANNGSGNARCTASGHGVVNDMYVRVTGTTNYNGEWVASNCTSTTFDIGTAYVSSQTGKWHTSLSGDTFVRFEDTTPGSNPRLLLDADHYVEVEEGMPTEFGAVVQASSVSGATVWFGANWYYADKTYLGLTAIFGYAVLNSKGVWQNIFGIVDAPDGARYGTPVLIKTNTAFHLAVDAMGARAVPAGFSAYRTGSTQSVGSGSTVTVACNTEEYDRGGNYDNSSTYQFTAPEPGTYLVRGSVKYYNGGSNFPLGKLAYLDVYVNSGTTVVPVDVRPLHTTVAYGYLGGAVPIPLGEGDTADIRTHHAEGTTLTLTTGRGTLFSVHKVGGH